MDKLKTPASDANLEARGLDKRNEDIIQHPVNKSEPDIVIDDDPLILIPEGNYPFGYMYYETCLYKDEPKLKMYFKLLDVLVEVDFGQHFWKYLEDFDISGQRHASPGQGASTIRKTLRACRLRIRPKIPRRWMKKKKTRRTSAFHS